MTSTLLFIRHAETNLAGRFCGHADPPLNERGLAQIEQLLPKLRTEPIQAVYCSDLTRAASTAQAIADAFGLSPVLLPGIREICFGEWETMNWAEIESRDADYAREWSEKFPLLPAPGGETTAAFEGRVFAEVDRLVREPGCAAVVTHAGVMRVILRRLCGADDQQAWEQTRAYCSIVRYEGDHS
jgi:broad specificity phosphatase PhoE